jgi:hypothetical protein
MEKRLCVLHANCQGDELARLLGASAAFGRAFRLERYTNYTREIIPEASFAGCDVFVYQHLGAHWGEFSSESLLGRIPAKAVSLCLPNMLFKVYWPFWTSDGPISFSDTLLDRLIAEEIPKDVILRLYLHTDIRRFIDLREALEETVSREREKERRCFMGTVDAVLAHWKRLQLFHTVNHPGTFLLEHVAGGLLEALGLPPLTAEERASAAGAETFPSYADFDLPIHPRVAAEYGLSFGGPEHAYTIFGRPMTFAQYVSRYIDCRRAGMDADFLGYLQLV